MSNSAIVAIVIGRTMATLGLFTLAYFWDSGWLVFFGLLIVPGTISEVRN